MTFKFFFMAGYLAILSSILFSQTPIKTDSSWMLHPEQHFWFSNSMPFILYNRAVSKQSHIIWNTAYHTAAPVPVGSVGPEKYTRQLKGIVQNTTIGKVMKEAVNDNVSVILVVGDGMGTVHMTLPIYMNVADANGKETMFEKIMKEGESGLVLTNTVNGLVTCSAAAGTALATGRKTRINMISVDSTGNPLETVLEIASRKGMKTAVVSDANITDATPAVFYGHAVNREDEADLALQLAYEKKVDVILGGGAGLFIPHHSKTRDIVEFENFPGDYNQFSARPDTLNLIDIFRQNNYSFACTREEMNKAPENKRLLGLFAPGGMPSPIGRDSSNEDIPTVSEMGEKALKVVNNTSKGYFAMIECGQIDWEAHSNDIGGVYKAVLEMDKTLKTAYSYYLKNKDKTLLIFTADHETGGLSIAYTKVENDQIEKYNCVNGDTWINNTNPLYFNNFKILSRQDISFGRILGISKTAGELKENVRKHTGYEISLKEAEAIYDAYVRIHGNIRIK